MSEKIVDKVFGEMEYKHSWTKKDNFLFLGKTYTVNVTAQAYKGDEILESQRFSYSNYKNFLQDHESIIKEKLMEYCKSTYDINISVEECLIPQTIIFERDGSWGILFDTDYDVENGVAIFIINGKIQVGPQDLFL